MPLDFFHSKNEVLHFDKGLNWKSNTTFGPLRYQQSHLKTFQKNNDSLAINIRSGISSMNEDLSVYFYEHITFKDHFYAFLYSRIVSNSDVFPRYTGISRKKSRFGLKSGEVDLSGFGYQNSWLMFQIGRGRQSWGAGNDIKLALSEQAAPYDHFLAGLDFRKIRFRYMHGFLESDSLGFNRYIVSRGLEYTNLKSIILSLSEIVIYSGYNRPFDFSYLNPISSHLEIELNERQNLIGTHSGNAVWQISLDWMVNDRLRFSGNLLYDEVVLDKSEIDLGKDHRTARSFRISNDFSILSSKSIVAYFSMVEVGTLTLRHGNGRNNFINRKIPLGWKNGSDCVEYKIGLNIFNKKTYILSFQGGQKLNGENNIINYPYETYNNYQFSSFPSGKVEKINFIDLSFKLVINSYLDITSSMLYEVYNSDAEEIFFNIGLDLHLLKRIL